MLQTFKTKKAARESGFRTRKEWLRDKYLKNGLTNRLLIPKQEAVPVIVKGEEFFQEADCEEVVSRKVAGRRGLAVPKGVKAVAELYARSYRVYYEVFRLSDCVQKKKVQKTPPCEIDLLLAVFTVNKSTKRYRDAAQEHYQHGQHGFAGFCRRQKEYLYTLKDRGIMQAFLDGRLRYSGIHGSFAVYRGEGYCFHSTYQPDSERGSESPDEETEIFIEASSKGASEARLVDAVETLERLPETTDGFEEVVSVQQEEVVEDSAQGPSVGFEVDESESGDDWRNSEIDSDYMEDEFDDDYPDDEFCDYDLENP